MIALSEAVCSSSIILLGSAIHATLGYGASLVWMTTLPLLMPVPQAVALTAPLRVGLSCLVLLKSSTGSTNATSSSSSSSSRGITKNLPERWAQIKYLLFGLPFGIAAGYSALNNLSPPAARFLLGLVIVGYVAWTTSSSESDSKKKKNDELSNLECGDSSSSSESSLSNPSSSTHRKKHMLAVCMGICSGFLNATFGTGAPPLLLYSREASWEPHHFRSNMQLIFLVTNILSVSRMILGGIITISTLSQTFLLVPFMMMGGFIGSVYVAPKIKKEMFRKVVLMSLASMGCMYLLEGVVSKISSAPNLLHVATVSAATRKLH